MPADVSAEGLRYGHISIRDAAEATRTLAETAPPLAPEPGNVPEETSKAADALRHSFKRLWVFSIPERICWRWPKKKWLAGPVIIAILPFVLNVLLILIHSPWALHTAKAWMWLLFFVSAQAGALLAARVIWHRVFLDRPMIVGMLPNDSADKKLATWICKWYSIRWQAMSAIVLSGIGVFVLWLASPDVGPRLELSPVSYVAVASMSATGGLVLYVFIMATLLAWAIYKCGPLVLDPFDPATTPGLRTLSQGYLYCLALLIVLAAGLETVAIAVPGYRESTVLRAFVVGFAVFAVLCGFFVTLFPHCIIAHATWVRKMQTITLIDKQIGDIRSSMESDHGRLVTLVWLRGQVLGGRALPIKVPWLVPMLAALVGPLLAFLLALKHL